MSAGSDSPPSSTNYLGVSQEGEMLLTAKVTDQTVSGKNGQLNCRNILRQVTFSKNGCKYKCDFSKFQKSPELFLLCACKLLLDRFLCALIKNVPVNVRNLRSVCSRAVYLSANQSFFIVTAFILRIFSLLRLINRLIFFKRIAL